MINNLTRVPWRWTQIIVRRCRVSTGDIVVNDAEAAEAFALEQALDQAYAFADAVKADSARMRSFEEDG